MKNTIGSEIFNKIHNTVLQYLEPKVSQELFYVLAWARSSGSIMVRIDNIIEDKVLEYGQANRYHDDPNRPDVYA